MVKIYGLIMQIYIICLSSVHQNGGHVLSKPPEIFPCAAPTMSSSDRLTEPAKSSKYALAVLSLSEILPRSASPPPSFIYARRLWSIPLALSDQQVFSPHPWQCVFYIGEEKSLGRLPALHSSMSGLCQSRSLSALQEFQRVSSLSPVPIQNSFFLALDECESHVKILARRCDSNDL
ncbi:hypothetical protein Dimus_038561 [Dionaea muscipula]